MLGRDLFKVESNVDLSNERFKSLVLFYTPLIGEEALVLYQFLAVKGSSGSFEELNKLLNSLCISIDSLEDRIKKLNEFKLVKTLKSTSENKYIFILNNPLTQEEFIKNEIFVRDFILKTSGEYYQSLLADYRYFNSYKDFEDVSAKLNPNDLSKWTINDEKYLTNNIRKDVYNFDTLFDINEFLKDISTTLFPLRFRSEENLRLIASLADLYNVPAEKMRYYLTKAVKTNSDEFNKNLLTYFCEQSVSEFKDIKPGVYNVPCVLFLMNKQGGKEVSKYDRKILYSLANSYHLKPEVINVLVEYTLKNCDNSLIEKYLYSIASDLNRNDINTASKALERLNAYIPTKKTIKTKEAIPTYNEVNNIAYDEALFDEIMKKR